MFGVYFSPHQRNIYVNTNSRGNQSSNKNKDIHSFSLVSDTDVENTVFLCRVKSLINNF